MVDTTSQDTYQHLYVKLAIAAIAATIPITIAAFTIYLTASLGINLYHLAASVNFDTLTEKQAKTIFIYSYMFTIIVEIMANIIVFIMPFTMNMLANALRNIIGEEPPYMRTSPLFPVIVLLLLAAIALYQESPAHAAAITIPIYMMAAIDALHMSIVTIIYGVKTARRAHHYYRSIRERIAYPG